MTAKNVFRLRIDSKLLEKLKLNKKETGLSIKKKKAEMWNTLYSSPGFIEVRTIRIY